MKSLKDDNYEIFTAVWKGDFAKYQILIPGYDINCRDEEGYSLLHMAIAHNMTIAEDTIKRSIDVNIRDKKGQTALHYLGVYYNLELAKKVLQHGGDVSIKDSYGNIPLWTAVFNAKGNYAYVDLLLQYGSDPNSINKAGRSPLSFAEQIKDANLVALLSKAQPGT